MIKDQQGPLLRVSYLPPFGPVDEMVVKESPRNKSSSLHRQSVDESIYQVSGSRSKFLQLIGALTLGQLDVILQLFLEPGKVSSQGSAISDVTLAEAFNLGCVFNRFQIGNR
jgi:hypothetical protein